MDLRTLQSTKQVKIMIEYTHNSEKTMVHSIVFELETCMALC